MRYSWLAILGALTFAQCVGLEDPGLDSRYDVKLGAPALVAGKRFRWTSMPVKLRHNPCTVSGCSRVIEDSVKKGLAFWQNNASLFGEIQTEYGEPADVEISYASALAGNAIGLCQTAVDQSSSGALVLTTPFSLRIATTSGGLPISPAELEFVAAHEMGHCLGLWSHSPNDGDLMYAFLNNKTQYTARDLNSLRYLYAQETDIGAVRAGQLGQHYHLIGEMVISPRLN